MIFVKAQQMEATARDDAGRTGKRKKRKYVWTAVNLDETREREM